MIAAINSTIAAIGIDASKTAHHHFQAKQVSSHKLIARNSTARFCIAVRAM
jgi:hypothetical protein